MLSVLVGTQVIAPALAIEGMDSVVKHTKSLDMVMKKSQSCHESYRIEARETIIN
ncbi:MAG: hypothetical protein L3J59_08490 [Methylococcaceae bacterium]|nr:hypothetical protein [Methylococcaceae bacterium]